MHRIWFVIASLSSVVCALVSTTTAEEIKFVDCPSSVRKTLQAEAKGFKIETVAKEKDEENETVYWAKVAIGGKTYDVGVLENGTLREVNLAVDDDDLPLDQCPAGDRVAGEAAADEHGVVGHGAGLCRILPADRVWGFRGIRRGAGRISVRRTTPF